MTHPANVRRIHFEAKRGIAGRSDPKTSYRGSHLEVGVCLFDRYRSVTVALDSSPFSVEHFERVSKTVRQTELRAKIRDAQEQRRRNAPLWLESVRKAAGK